MSEDLPLQYPSCAIASVLDLARAQAADNLPLYGVCCYMEEMVHRPPAVLSDLWPQCSTPLSRYLVAAPRCYCFLTHFPFFTLHMKVRARMPSRLPISSFVPAPSGQAQ